MLVDPLKHPTHTHQNTPTHPPTHTPKHPHPPKHTHAVYLHCLPDLCTQFGIDSAGITTSLPLHMLVSGVFLAAPGLLVWAADTAVCMTSGECVGGGLVVPCDAWCVL